MDNNSISTIANNLSTMSEAALNTVNTGVSALKEVAISAINCRNQYNLIAGEIEKTKIDANTSLEKIREIYKGKKEALDSLKSQVDGQLLILNQIDIDNLDEKKIEVYKTVTQALMFLADKICTLYSNAD